MRIIARTLFYVIILVIVAACQQDSLPIQEDNLPTVFQLPTPTPIPTETPMPSQTPRPTLPIPTATVTLTPELPTMTAIIIPSLVPTDIPPPATETRIPPFLPPLFSFGKSLQGRDLVAHKLGAGGTVIMLVGGIHGGWEANTITLIEELIHYFETNPNDVLPTITLLFIPSLNPDGAALGRILDGRFNANRVDLNRNWGCDWEAVAYFQETQVNPGTQAFSEAETLALGALINDVHPSTVLFYHSAANGIFGGDCGGNSHSTSMVAVYGNATGYPYGGEFTSYVVTGTASNWVDGMGIPSADVELAGVDTPEFARNLRGVMALQCWLSGEIAAGYAQCAS